MIMKTATLGIAIGTAIAALGLAITAVPEAKAGGVYSVSYTHLRAHET